MSEDSQKPENQNIRVQGIASEESAGSPGGDEAGEDARSEHERIFDEQIRPLTDQVYALCVEHEIPYASSFDLGNGVTASSACHWYDAPQNNATYLVGALLQAIRMQDDMEMLDESEASDG